MRTGKVLHSGSASQLLCNFGHSLQIVLIAVVEGIGQKVLELLLEILLNIQIILVVLLELEYIIEAFLDLLLNFVAIQLDDRFGSRQEGPRVFHFIEEHLQLCDDVVDSVHFYDEIRLLRGYFVHLFLDEVFQIIEVALRYLLALLADVAYFPQGCIRGELHDSKMLCSSLREVSDSSAPTCSRISPILATHLFFSVLKESISGAVRMFLWWL